MIVDKKEKSKAKAHTHTHKMMDTIALEVMMGMMSSCVLFFLADALLLLLSLFLPYHEHLIFCDLLFRPKKQEDSFFFVVSS